MKRLLCLLLVLSMFVVISACSKQETTGDEDTTVKVETTKGKTTASKKTTEKKKVTKKEKTTQKVEENPFSKPYEVTWLVQYTKNYQEGRWDELELEEKFNIDLKVWNVDYDNAEELTMMISAGDVPDMGFYPKDPIQLYEQGLTRTINMDLLKQYLPGYYEIIEEYPIGLEYNKVPETENEYYGITMASALSKFFYFNHGMRLDWLQNLGFTVDDLTSFTPGKAFEAYGDYSKSLYFSNRVFTYDEFLEINRAFTEDDPDGNGEDDTYFGISLGFHSWNRLTLATFGLSHDGRYLYKDDLTGDVVPYYAYEGYRDFLVWETDALEKGYIRKLPGEDNWLNELYAAWASGKPGYFELSAQMVLADHKVEQAMEQAPGSILKEDPEATFIIFPGFTGPLGYGGNTRYSPTPFRAGAWGTWKIEKNVPDEKLIRILQMMQYTHFNKDAFMRYFYGIEGVHYKWSGTPSESSIITTPLEKIPMQYSSGAPMNIFASNKFLMDMSIWTLFSTYYYTWNLYQEENGWDKYIIEPYKYNDRMYYTAELYEEYETLSEELSEGIGAIRSDFWDRAHSGQVADINTEWSSYIDSLYEAGLEDLVGVFNSDDFATFIKID